MVNELSSSEAFRHLSALFWDFLLVSSLSFVSSCVLYCILLTRITVEISAEEIRESPSSLVAVDRQSLLPQCSMLFRCSSDQLKVYNGKIHLSRRPNRYLAIWPFSPVSETLNVKPPVSSNY